VESPSLINLNVFHLIATPVGRLTANPFRTTPVLLKSW
jgi:hypothetical protein